MKVLAVASELYPLVKTGGLADVTGALPPALARRGIEMRTLIPGYPAVMEGVSKGKLLHRYPALLGAEARLVAARAGEVELIVLDAPALFDRPGGPYAGAGGGDHIDNWRRFAALSKAGADIAGGIAKAFRPDLVQSHDWQAAMTAAYLRYAGNARPSVVTIHNLAFQGHFPAAIFGALELPAEAYGLDGVEYYGGVGYLKGGLQSAWAITTVSPTYATEIATPAFGMGLDGLISLRADTLSGIVNGIDTEVWDPARDPHLTATYSARSMKGRAVNRRAIETHFGLDADNAPLFEVVSRITWQKGIDILASATDAIVAAGGKLAVLGAGDAALEGQFLGLAARHRGRVGVTIGYDEALSHRMQGGGDAILIPSRFEPCGLTQLYGLRYGCVPVVARTGGLADTVIDANPAALSAGVATGIQFSPIDAAGLIGAVRRAVALYHEPKAWSAMQRQGMKADVSWDASAERYAALFEALLAAAGSKA
jgi:starch synthase